MRLLDISFLDCTENVNWDFKASGLDNKTFKKKIYKYTKTFFTPRERELIRVIVKGYTNKKIGVYLNISEHTVSSHRKNILKKSNCHNFNELEIFCKGRGIL
jgi:DNA-binding NarL/FixJ family response regulator